MHAVFLVFFCLFAVYVVIRLIFAVFALAFNVIMFFGLTAVIALVVCLHLIMN